jgi:hypothetical protein
MTKNDEWWSVCQTLLWIVERDHIRLEQAGHLKQMRALKLLPKLTAVSGNDGRPPIPLEAAGHELLRAARTGRVEIQGRKYGSALPTRVPVNSLDVLADHRGQACIGAPGMYRGNETYWGALYVRAGDCIREWAPRPDLAATVPDAAPERTSLSGEAVAIPTAPVTAQIAATPVAKRRHAHNEIREDEPVLKRMKEAIDCGEASSPHKAALLEARKITQKSSGKDVDTTLRRLKRKYKNNFPGP